jgi:hypothetical protein
MPETERRDPEAGSREPAAPGAAGAPAAHPLRLQLQLVTTPARANAASVSVRIVASAPCHLAAYQVDAGGRVTPLLAAAGAARMPASTAFRLATRPRGEEGSRVIALASRQPIPARAFYRCLLAFLSEPGAAAELGQGDGPGGAAAPSPAEALTAVSGYLARQVGVDAASLPLPERSLWAAGVSPPCLPVAGARSRG